MRRRDVDTLRAILRDRAPRRIHDPGAKQAAVAAVLRFPDAREDAEAEVLFIRRAVRPGDHWSGHMAFPGGRFEAHDADLRATAVRETAEEVGLDLDGHGELLGPLDEQWPRSGRGLVVAPWLWVLRTPEVVLTPNHEVAETVWAPLAPMIRGETATEHPLHWNGMDVRMPAFRVGERVVWGMTQRMLASLFALLEAARARSGAD